MATFIATTASNAPRLKDPAAALKVIGGFCFEGDVAVGVEADPESGQKRLILYGEDWPGAFKIPTDKEATDFEPDYNEEPADGWEQFLKAISPYLQEPL